MSADIDPYNNSSRNPQSDLPRGSRADLSRVDRSRSERARQTRKNPEGKKKAHEFRSFVLTILLVLLVFILAFSATFYARSRGWLKGKAPADPAVIQRMFKAL